MQEQIQQNTPIPEPMLEQESSSDHTTDKISPVEVTLVAFGPKGAWFLKWSNGQCAYEGLPPTLHAKLDKRSASLPAVKHLSMSELGHWAVVFEDGSCATSGISVQGRLQEALDDADDSEIRSLLLAPGGGWILTRENGYVAHERLPSTLQALLSRRNVSDPPIDQITISGFGGWFIRFADGECEWEALPKPLEKVLIQMIRRGDPNLVISLAPIAFILHLLKKSNITEADIIKILHQPPVHVSPFLDDLLLDFTASKLYHTLSDDVQPYCVDYLYYSAVLLDPTTRHGSLPVPPKLPSFDLLSLHIPLDKWIFERKNRFLKNRHQKISHQTQTVEIVTQPVMNVSYSELKPATDTEISSSMDQEHPVEHDNHHIISHEKAPSQKTFSSDGEEDDEERDEEDVFTSEGPISVVHQHPIAEIQAESDSTETMTEANAPLDIPMTNDEKQDENNAFITTSPRKKRAIESSPSKMSTGSVKKQKADEMDDQESLEAGEVREEDDIAPVAISDLEKLVKTLREQVEKSRGKKSTDDLLEVKSIDEATSAQDSPKMASNDLVTTETAATDPPAVVPIDKKPAETTVVLPQASQFYQSLYQKPQKDRSSKNDSKRPLPYARKNSQITLPAPVSGFAAPSAPGYYNSQSSYTPEYVLPPVYNRSGMGYTNAPNTYVAYQGQAVLDSTYGGRQPILPAASYGFNPYGAPFYTNASVPANPGDGHALMTVDQMALAKAQMLAGLSNQQQQQQPVYFESSGYGPTAGYPNAKQSNASSQGYNPNSKNYF